MNDMNYTNYDNLEMMKSTRRNIELRQHRRSRCSNHKDTRATTFVDLDNNLLNQKERGAIPVRRHRHESSLDSSRRLEEVKGIGREYLVTAGG